MTDQHACADREELMAYLYDECDAAGQARVAAHLAGCDHCRTELDGLRDVRRALSHWAPPERDRGFAFVPRATATPWWTVWRVPLAAAAAILVLAGAAGLAHVEVRYDTGGLVVRTGWASAPDTAPAAAAVAAVATSATMPATAADAMKTAPSQAPWRPELAAFEARIDQQLKAQPTLSQTAPVSQLLPSQAGLLQRVQTMVQESEQRQQRQFALKLTDVMRDVESQRRADLVRIDQNFGQIEGTTGAAVAQQRELWNYLVRVAQHPQ